MRQEEAMEGGLEGSLACSQLIHDGNVQCVCKLMRVSIEVIEGATRANRDFWLLCSDAATYDSVHEP